MTMEYKQVQKIAKDTIEYIKQEIKPGMNLLEIRKKCEEKMLELGADSFWYYDIGGFVFSGDETTISVSGKTYMTSDRILRMVNLWNCKLLFKYRRNTWWKIKERF